VGNIPAERNEPPPIEAAGRQQLNPRSLGSVLEQLVWRARHHKVIVYDSWRGDTAVTPMLRSAQRELLASGRTVMVLTQPESLLDADESRLDDIRRDGAQIRVRRSRLPDAIIVDRRLAVLRASADWPDRNRILLIQEPALVTGLHSSFVSVWDDAVELSRFQQLTVNPDHDDTRSILRQLFKGCKDETAAKELDISVRTYRRRVADIMDRLGATSRFQAGALAVRLGLVHVWDEELRLPAPFVLVEQVS
jgi:DNA-binding CsgD family transcriptional regulator